MVTTHTGIVRDGNVEFQSPLTLPEGSQVRVAVVPLLDEKQVIGKANVWLAHNAGDAVGVMNGTFVQTGQQTLWRFEAFITGSQFDPIGPIGQLDVDAETGQILSTSQTAEAMIERGRTRENGN